MVDIHLANIIFTCAAAVLLARAASADVFVAEPAPELDRLFQNQDGWIGADGSYSVDLGKGRVAWLFSDTFVGRVTDGRRVDAVMINNSVAVQPGIRRRPEFYYQNENEKPASFIKPNDGRGYYWLFAGAMAGKQMVMFLNQIESTGGGGAFSFRGIGCRLGIVANPAEHPSEWKISQHDVPHQSYTGEITGHFGSAILSQRDYLYCYGYRKTSKEGAAPVTEAILARVPAANPERFEAWRFYAGGRWVSDWKEASPLFRDPASEYSVSWLPGAGRYVMVYMVGIWGKVAVRTAPSPEGPWSEPVEVFSCPEMQWDKDYFCYAAKAHPELAISDDELIVTYACNSHNFSKLLSDARIYYPRFLRIRAMPEAAAVD